MSKSFADLACGAKYLVVSAAKSELSVCTVACAAPAINITATTLKIVINLFIPYPFKKLFNSTRQKA
jgi:hypothetical protein